MKLSELVAFRNHLKQISINIAKSTADYEIGEITHLVNNYSSMFGEQANVLETKKLEIKQSFDAFAQELEELKKDVDDAIATTEKPWFVESYRLYEEEMCNETVDYLLTRKLDISESAETTLRSRLKTYADWRYPGMIIAPGQENLIQEMVGLDPLYVLDQYYELLEPALNQFSDEYRRRLRPHLINERNSKPILGKMPNSQFGVCLVYNFFNFRPLQVVKEYLNEIHKKLRPGGILIMTINDCDRAPGVKLVERHFACYTPANLVIEMAQSLGYQINHTWHDAGPSTWIELQKAGELTTIRGGQTLAEIISK